MKHFAVIMLMVLLLLGILVFNVSAYKLAPFFVCEVDLNAIPEGSRYLDMLVCKSDLPSGQFISDAIHLNLNGFVDDAPIVQYDVDGYVSYMFHCKDAAGCNQISDCIDSGSTVLLTFGEDANRHHTKEMLSLLKCLKNVRFAYLDSEGNILSVTETAQPNRFAPWEERNVIVLRGDSVETEFSFKFPYILIPILILLFILFICLKRRHSKSI